MSLRLLLGVLAPARAPSNLSSAQSKPLSTAEARLDLTAGLNKRMDALRSNRDPARSPERPASPVKTDDSARPGTTTTKPNSRENRPSIHGERQRLRSRPETIDPRSNDIWTATSTSARAADSVDDASAPAETMPLTSVNINTLPPNRLLRRDSTQTTPPEVAPAEHAVKTEFPRRDVPATTILTAKSYRQPTKGKPATVTTESEEQLNQAYLSSSFEVNAPVMSPLLPTPKSPVLEERPKSRPDAKENEKPTTAWSSINAPVTGRRITSAIPNLQAQSRNTQ